MRREMVALLGDPLAPQTAQEFAKTGDFRSRSMVINQQRLLNVMLVVGVQNGSGKTTTIAKPGIRHYQQQGYRVTLAAADTFRAAAIDPASISVGERYGSTVIAHQPGADPGAVAFDAIKSSRARGATVVIIDTAGRLHTKYNLMKELEKLRSIIARQVVPARHETLLVLDATTGQNALSQAAPLQRERLSSAAWRWPSWTAPPKAAWCSASGANWACRCASSAPAKASKTWPNSTPRPS